MPPFRPSLEVKKRISQYRGKLISRSPACKVETYTVKQLNEILTKDDFKAKATFLVVRKCKFLRKPLFPIKHGCHVVETTNTLVKRQVQRIT